MKTFLLKYLFMTLALSLSFAFAQDVESDSATVVRPTFSMTPT